jgi:hypothetical protein
MSLNEYLDTMIRLGCSVEKHLTAKSFKVTFQTFDEFALFGMGVCTFKCNGIDWNEYAFVAEFTLI